MERYDIAIIGTGPAGLSAAITAKLRNKKILLLGSANLSKKVEKAQTIRNYLGLTEVSGAEMQQVFQKHLAQMEIAITEDRANAIYAMGEYFAIQAHKENYEASSVILAMGLFVAKPYPGELENLGRGVSYCATCDAALYRGKTAIVVGFSEKEEKEAAFLAEIAEKVYYLPMYSDCDSLPDTLEPILNARPEKMERTSDGMCLIMKGRKSEADGKKTETDEKKLEADGIFLLREQLAPAQLVPGIKVDGNHIEVDRQMRTNIKGMFACGDIVGEPYQYIKAAGEGNVAALSAVAYLSE